MVFGLLKLGQKSPEEEFKEQAKQELEAKKAQGPTEEKAANFDQFLKHADTVKLTNEWKKKGFTKRGVVKLLSVLFPVFKSNTGVISAAKDILSSLKGEDGLSRLLGVLKLVPEGLMKGMK